jgi:hypothetical protein
MPSAITKSKPNTRSRRLSGQQRPQLKPIAIGIISATKNVAVMTIVFDQAVSLKGVPQYTTNLAGITALSAELTNPTTLEVTFSATVATATSLIIPFEDPAVRNASGGYANAGTFPVA